MKVSFPFAPFTVGFCLAITVAVFVMSQPWTAPLGIWALVVGSAGVALASIGVLLWTKPRRRAASNPALDDSRARFTHAGVFATIAANQGILLQRDGYPGQVWVAVVGFVAAVVLIAVALTQLKRSRGAGARGLTRRPASSDPT